MIGSCVQQSLFCPLSFWLTATAFGIVLCLVPLQPANVSGRPKPDGKSVTLNRDGWLYFSAFQPPVQSDPVNTGLLCGFGCIVMLGHKWLIYLAYLLRLVNSFSGRCCLAQPGHFTSRQGCGLFEACLPGVVSGGTLLPLKPRHPSRPCIGQLAPLPGTEWPGWHRLVTASGTVRRQPRDS